MDTKELLKKVRKIEIKTRRLSDHVFGGEYHSTFKGRGMTFSEVRQYQFGDDVRSIDWNVTARYNEPFVKVFEEERERYARMHEFVKRLEQDWYFFTYEDMVQKNFEALNNYLGFKLEADAEVPKSTGKAKVIRKKASGDWRHWFTEEDISLFMPAYREYMGLIGYDYDDWNLSSNPTIEPQYSSIYMQNQAQRATKSLLRQLMNPIAAAFQRGD